MKTITELKKQNQNRDDKYLPLGLYHIPKEEKELLCYISPSVNT